jgi:hypothetical protein
MNISQQISEARELILARIAHATQVCDRQADDIKLVAVSKRQSDDRILAALSAGHRVFGENRVQEAQAHWAARRAEYPDLELRLIGPLQSNKAADAVALFDVIETLDRESLASALRKAIDTQNRTPRLIVQVNTGEEDQKSGVNPNDLPDFLARMSSTHGLKVEGLMCIPPVEEAASLHFALLACLAANAGLTKLSMGMSADFETAIRMGATSVRVGSALFGAREG